jgi:hypothetical protein
MDKLSFNAHLSTTKNALEAKLELYLFRDGSVYITYCPSLDLSACGKTEEEAKSEFGTVFGEHIAYCISNNTLANDLKNHGWTIKSKKKLQAPSTEQMLSTNSILKDIVFHRNSYQKVEREVQIPAFA